MRLIVWLFRAFVFFALFAFALNNRDEATVRWFFGHEWHAPMVIIVLVAFAGGCAIGVLAMVPAWWRHRRVARAQQSDESVMPPPKPAVDLPDLPNSQLPSDYGLQHPPRDGV